MNIALLNHITVNSGDVQTISRDDLRPYDLETADEAIRGGGGILGFAGLTIKLATCATKTAACFTLYRGALPLTTSLLCLSRDSLPELQEALSECVDALHGISCPDASSWPIPWLATTVYPCAVLDMDAVRCAGQSEAIIAFALAARM